MEHVATEQPPSQKPHDGEETDAIEPEIRFRSLMLPEIVDMPTLSDLPRWLRRPIERVKRSR
jgi:hypothetical protein